MVLTEDSVGSNTYKITPVDGTLLGTYTFEIRASADSFATYYSKVYSLKIMCGAGSVEITEPTSGVVVV